MRYFYLALGILRAEGLVRGPKTIVKEFFRRALRRGVIVPFEQAPRVREHFAWIFQSETGQRIEERQNFSNDLLVVCPPPGQGSGGHRTLFRFLELAADQGLRVAITFSNSGANENNALNRDFQSRIYEWFGSQVPVVSGPKAWSTARCLMATSWATAYDVRPFEKTHTLYYFIQDLEYMFYEDGFYREQANRTYDFGYKAITAGPWIRDALRERKTRILSHFNFGTTNHAFCSSSTQNANFQTSRIFLYLRPSTARRGLETSLIALEKLHDMRRDFTVITAGSNQISFQTSFGSLHKGILSEEELNETICSCDIGFVLSYTNKSLMSDEILSHGLTLVTNSGEQAVWGLPADGVFIGEGPDEIAQALSKAIDYSRLGLVRDKRHSPWEQEMKNSVFAIVRDISGQGGVLQDE